MVQVSITSAEERRQPTQSREGAPHRITLPIADIRCRSQKVAAGLFDFQDEVHVFRAGKDVCRALEARFDLAEDVKLVEVVGNVSSLFQHVA